MSNKKQQNLKKSDTANVEFGNEFGDMNAAKLYELPFMNKEKVKKDKNNKC